MARRICPRCGSRKVAQILWGLPYFSEGLQKKLENETIHLGDCCITGEDPKYYCNICKKHFGAPTKQFEEDVIMIKVLIGGFLSGYKTIEVSKTDHGAIVKSMYSLLNCDDSSKNEKEVSNVQWEKLVSILFRCNIVDWEKEYYSPNILDGEQWELEVLYCMREPLRVFGSNKYPPHFSKFRKLINNLLNFVENETGPQQIFL